MTTMSLRMPDYLKAAANDLCADEKISLNQFILNAMSEKISALQTLDIIEQRSRRASRSAFDKALASIPDHAPDPRDTIL